MNKTIFVNQLPLEAQEKIKELIRDHLYANVCLAPYQRGYKEALDNAMNGRLSDLESVINIEKVKYK